jgi:hypothetical protein
MLLPTADRSRAMNRPLVRLLVSAICCLGLAGCGPGGDSSTVREGHLVKVFYDDKPIGGVEVRFYSVPHFDGNQPAYVGFSDTSGSAYLTPLGADAAAIDAMQWKVAVLSDGDGSWMIDPKFNDPAKAGIELRYGVADAVGDSAASIHLPDGAIRSLAR